jgi:hypothetical protein
MGLTAACLFAQVARPAPAERRSGKNEEKKNRERTALELPLPGVSPLSFCKSEKQCRQKRFRMAVLQPGFMLTISLPRQLRLPLPGDSRSSPPFYFHSTYLHKIACAPGVDGSKRAMPRMGVSSGQYS